MNKSISISVVIPVFNGGPAFRQCLSSFKHSKAMPLEIIVVLDGVTDDSLNIANQFNVNIANQFNVRIIQLPVNSGPAKARNIGAEAAQGDILFFMDADVTLHSNTLGLIEQKFQQQPSLAAVIGSYDDAPSADNFLSQYKNLFHYYTHQVSSEVASTFWGACGAIRKSVFQKVGGFDEGYRHPSIEDIELGYRLKQFGYSIHLCKDIQVKHLKRWKPISLLQAEIFYRALPWTDLILRNRHFDADLNLSPRNQLSVVLVFALTGILVISGLFPWLWFTATSILFLALLIINVDVYRFFYVKRGLLFTLQVIPWHWFYFFYGGVAFAYAMLKHYLVRLRLPELGKSDI